MMSAGWPALAPPDVGEDEPAKVYVGEVLTPIDTPAPATRTRLGSIREVRAELARCYRDVRAGRMDAATGTKLTFMLSVLARLIAEDELEGRVRALEGRGRS